MTGQQHAVAASLFQQVNQPEDKSEEGVEVASVRYYFTTAAVVFRNPSCLWLFRTSMPRVTWLLPFVKGKKKMKRERRGARRKWTDAIVDDVAWRQPSVNHPPERPKKSDNVVPRLRSNSFHLQGSLRTDKNNMCPTFWFICLSLVGR